LTEKKELYLRILELKNKGFSRSMLRKELKCSQDSISFAIKNEQKLKNYSVINKERAIQVKMIPIEQQLFEIKDSITYFYELDNNPKVISLENELKVLKQELEVLKESRMKNYYKPPLKLKPIKIESEFDKQWKVYMYINYGIKRYKEYIESLSTFNFLLLCKKCYLLKPISIEQKRNIEKVVFKRVGIYNKYAIIKAGNNWSKKTGVNMEYEH